MKKWSECGSYAINPGLNNRGDDNLNLCDVCYWQDKVKQLESENAKLKKENEEMSAAIEQIKYCGKDYR